MEAWYKCYYHMINKEACPEGSSLCCCDCDKALNCDVSCAHVFDKRYPERCSISVVQLGGDKKK